MNSYTHATKDAAGNEHQTCESLSAQFSHSVVLDSVTPWTAARQASLSITDS